MKRAEWEEKFAALPRGLSLAQAAKRLHQTYRLTATWAKELGYPYISDHRAVWTLAKRKGYWRVPWHRVPWQHMTNAQIARRHGVSRECVRLRRAEFAPS